MTNVFNAFNQGNNIGRGIKQGRDNKAVTGMVASGDYAGAQKMAADNGNLEQYEKIKAFAATQDAATVKKEAERFQAFGSIAFAAKNVAPDQREAFIRGQLQNSGHDPDLIVGLAGLDDNTLTAFGQSAMSMKDQLAQFTTGMENVNDTMVETRTNNFTGKATARNAFNVAPSYSDVTTRQNNEADNQLAIDALAETSRSNIAKEGIDRTKAATAAATGSGAASFGLTPVYGRDADGNRVLIQTNKAGGVRKADLPEGVTLEDDTFKTSARAQGKTQGETLANMPAIENNADRALKTVEQLLNHDGIDAGTGFSSKIPAVPGSNKYAFNVANKQAQGQVFLQGFEALKGGGVITEVEGLKAEQALARMDQAQSREDYEAGLKDYRDVINNGMAAAYRKAGKPVPPKYATPGAQSPAQTMASVSTAAEYAALPSGAKFTDPQGNVRTKQ